MATPTTLKFAESPLSGRLRFKLRPLTNWLFCSVVFAAVAFALVQFIPSAAVWFADAGAIAILFYLNFFVLDVRSIRMRCPHCRGKIETNVPWVCGECRAKNQRIDEFPFVHRCEHCSAEPKAHKCHHCGELIFLTEDTRRQNYSTSVNHPVQTPTEPEPKSDCFESKKQSIEEEIVLTELAAKLNASKQRLEFAKQKSPTEEIEESYTKHFAKHMGSRQFARKQKAVNAVEYKDDPEGLKDADDTVDDWLKGRT
jgi:hypothetical protein